jgi:hypothetical protein
MGIGIIDSVLGVAAPLLDKFIVDKDKKAEFEHELKMVLHNANLQQNQINLEQAKHPSIFVAGARPAIMWICAFGLAWAYVLAPVLNWVLVVSGLDVPLPEIATEGLMTLTMSMLGLGGMRSFEKMNGIARENLKATPPKQ